MWCARSCRAQGRMPWVPAGPHDIEGPPRYSNDATVENGACPYCARWCGADTRRGSAQPMILPKVRDPRFVRIRRGGALTDSDHHLLALRAASCAEHVLDLFESAQPDDPRPREAIQHARAWVRGEVTMMQARAAGGHAMGAARNLWGSAACRVRRWPGRGRRTRRRARTRGRRLCDQGRTCCRARRRE